MKGDWERVEQEYDKCFYKMTFGEDERALALRIVELLQDASKGLESIGFKPLPGAYKFDPAHNYSYSVNGAAEFSQKDHWGDRVLSTTVILQSELLD